MTNATRSTRIGEEIRRLRVAAGLNLKDLARQTELFSIRLDQIERGQVTPTRQELERIVDCLQGVGAKLTDLESLDSADLDQRSVRNDMAPASLEQAVRAESAHVKSQSVDSVDCPQCGLSNPTAAQHCQCGYNFTWRGHPDEFSASQSRRLLNFLIDNVILVMIGFGLTRSVLPGGLTVLISQDRVAALLYGVFVAFAYYFALELVLQKTVAKVFTDTEVVAADLSRPSAMAIAARTVLRFVPFEPLTGSGGTWGHDRWSGTRVVKPPAHVEGAA